MIFRSFLRSPGLYTSQMRLMEKQVNNMQLFKFWLLVDVAGCADGLCPGEVGPCGERRTVAKLSASLPFVFIHP